MDKGGTILRGREGAGQGPPGGGGNRNVGGGGRRRDNGKIPAILVANNTDLREGGIDSRSEINTKEALEFARGQDVEYFE